MFDALSQIRRQRFYAPDGADAGATGTTTQAPAPTDSPASEDVSAIKAQLEAVREDAKRRDKALREAQAKLKTFEDAQAKAEHADLEAKGEYQKALAKAREEAAAKEGAILGRLRQTTINQALLSAAVECKAIDAGDVAFALQQAFTLDPNTYEPTPDAAVLKGLGIEATVDLRPRTVAEVVRDYLEKRPHMRAPQAPGGGTGTRPAGVPPPSFTPGSPLPTGKKERADLRTTLEQKAEQLGRS